MNILDIDWNGVCRQKHAETSFPTRDPQFWDRRAPEFTRHATKSDYIGQFLRILNPEPHWSVLDVGCAAGTLAVPLADRVKTITAVDASGGMLALLDERCREKGIHNIRSVRGRWEDNWADLAIGVHDVAIGSRSLLVQDLRSAIAKLDEHARERVYLSTIVGDGPHDRRIIEAAGRRFHPGADYIYIVNLLYQMGIHANLTFTVHEEDKSFANIDEAVQGVRWMLEGMTAEEDERIRKFLPEHLVPVDGRLRMPGPRIVRWAVLWWDKKWDGR